MTGDDYIYHCCIRFSCPKKEGYHWGMIATRDTIKSKKGYEEVLAKIEEMVGDPRESWALISLNLVSQ